MSVARLRKLSQVQLSSWAWLQGESMFFQSRNRSDMVCRNIVGPFLFKDSEAPQYLTGVIGCMVSRALEVSSSHRRMLHHLIGYSMYAL